jgi:hypothetical protein
VTRCCLSALALRTKQKALIIQSFLLGALTMADRYFPDLLRQLAARKRVEAAELEVRPDDNWLVGSDRNGV